MEEHKSSGCKEKHWKRWNERKNKGDKNGGKERSKLTFTEEERLFMKLVKKGQ